MKVEAPEQNVWIEASALDKINLWTGMAQGEVSGLGLVEKVEKGFHVTEVFLPCQDCTGTATVMDPAAVARLMIEVEAHGHDPSKLKFWWHSHADMKVFWSPTDQNTISLFRPQDFFVSMVVNKLGHRLARVDYYSPFRLCFQEVDTQIVLPAFPHKELCEVLFKERVSESTMNWGNSYVDFDLLCYTKEEIVNKVTTGDLDQEEAEYLLAERELQLKERNEGRWLDGWD